MLDDARQQFELALESNITRKNAMGNLVRTYARLGERDQTTRILEAYRTEFGADDESFIRLCAEYEESKTLRTHPVDDEPADPPLGKS